MSLRGRSIQEIGIGILGVGGIAREHLKAYRKHGFKVVAGLDSNSEALPSIKAEFGVPFLTTSLDEFLGRKDVDVVDVAVPHYFETRRPLIEAVARAGKPIFCQKPMAETLAQGVELVRLAEKAGVPFMMHQSALFVPGLKAAGPLLKDENRFGQPFYFQIENRGDLWFDRHPHWGSRDRWILNGMGIHHLALAQHWFGTPEKVWSLLVKDPGRPDIKAENVAVVGLEYAGGLKGVVINNWGYRGNLPRSHPREEIIVQGSRGALSGNIAGFTLKTRAGEEISPRIEGDWFPDAFGHAMAHFLESLSSGKPFLSSAREDLKVMAAAEAAYESAKTGKAESPLELLKKTDV
jgi:predicted dehydrogenase